MSKVAILEAEIVLKLSVQDQVKVKFPRSIDRLMGTESALGDGYLPTGWPRSKAISIISWRLNPEIPGRYGFITNFRIPNFHVPRNAEAVVIRAEYPIGMSPSQSETTVNYQFYRKTE